MWVQDGYSGSEQEHSLEPFRIDLGKGKRQIYSGGMYNSKYMITVPDREISDSFSSSEK